ncbi:putative quinone oxidoreductase, YhdH/YhfP family [Cohaesibacter sp. ES.047]|uniref:acrylyl-CoA reductase (NADPH) n=1 Tax=Cohaesibacter sp. ES.047 TaxID=1798205 RepID=UPI000BB7BFB4|nr:MDR family oxidoreductase [Cohaesibacter sp. ES.047]SNY92552.1 putative quinone oxidoreductase, YhdH/YhfP family [Cohaesibacter sp. ES.047]
MDDFKAIVIDRDDQKKQSVAVKHLTEADLMEGDVTVKVSHSTVNYKDGLAITGKSPVVRRWPMVPGIDMAGEVIASDNAEFKVGDAVILNGWGVGETHMGAFSEVARVKSDWLIHKPEGLTPAQCMGIGTAGYTAMLCVMALEKAGVTPDKGPVLVTGAAGGVGSVAISLLSKLGFHVIASTGRMSEGDYLKGLGAAELIDRNELSEAGRPLGKERWAGAVDSVGSQTLANVLAQTQYGGAVSACGLAQGFDLPSTVMPFILRGVSLLGIDSVMAAKEKRVEAWQRLASDLDTAKLDSLTKTIGFDDIIKSAEDIIAGNIRGRVIIDING